MIAAPTMSSILLPEYSVSLKTGFLPEDPPVKRLENYEEWEKLMDIIAQLIQQQEMRNRIHKLPLLPVSDSLLPTENHWRRAYRILTFLSQAYLWERGEKGTVNILPQQLAIPWWEVSARCGIAPVGTYTSTVLWNWHLKDTSLPATFENCQITFTFSGTRSEEWFYLIPLGVELAAVPGIKATIECFAAAKNGDIKGVTHYLNEVKESIVQMEKILVRMYDECKPEEFYDLIRPFQAGTKNLVAFSSGLIYEGVDKEAKSYGGASAGQSSTLPVFDILLNVVHYDTAKEFLDTQRWHMPRQHRQFLMYLSQQPSLREFILRHKDDKDLVESYNNCITQLGSFRSQHIILVTRYIVGQAKRFQKDNVDETSDGTLATTGTGGSDFMIFLKSVRDDTLGCLITC